MNLCMKCISDNLGLLVVLVDHLADGDFKDLKKGTAADKVLRDKAFNITKVV